MENMIVTATPSEARSGTAGSLRVIRLCCAVLLLFITAMPNASRAQAPLQPEPAGAEPIPEPAVPAILAAFDKYEVVGMPAAHGMKDEDDFILSLIRNPAFLAKVNDIEVECGNSLYQPVLDRYIAGENVPFREVRKVWRNTTQPACGVSGFYEQLFPLVRAINQKLPAGRRVRVLAGDSPIDGDKIKILQEWQDALKAVHRDASIASVMEKEVLSKHRKALMLFGLFHIVHGAHSAVSLYEKEYPNVTFVLSGFGVFDANLPALAGSAFAAWPVPSLARAKGTWLGALDVSRFFPPPVMIDQDCNAHHEFPKELQKRMEELVDAFLYLGPQDFRLKEQMPADIALDVDYQTEELRRRGASPGEVARILNEQDQQIMASAENPLFVIDTKPPDESEIQREVQACLERNRRGSPRQ